MDLLDAAAVEADAFLADFGEDATHTPAGGGVTRTIRGVCDRITELTDMAELIQMEGVAATFRIATAAEPKVGRDDTVTVRGSAYRVVGVQPDGTGHTVLVLGI